MHLFTTASSNSSISWIYWQIYHYINHFRMLQYTIFQQKKKWSQLQKEKNFVIKTYKNYFSIPVTKIQREYPPCYHFLVLHFLGAVFPHDFANDVITLLTSGFVPARMIENCWWVTKKLSKNSRHLKKLLHLSCK